MFSKKFKFSMITCLLIAFCVFSINVLFSQATDDDIVGYKCDNYLTETYTDANGDVIEKGCEDIPKAKCDTTSLTLTINESTGCNTEASLYTCKEETVVKNEGTVQCGWIKTTNTEKCDATSFSSNGQNKADCSDKYVGSN